MMQFLITLDRVVYLLSLENNSKEKNILGGPSDSENIRIGFQMDQSQLKGDVEGLGQSSLNKPRPVGDSKIILLELIFSL